LETLTFTFGVVGVQHGVGGGEGGGGGGVQQGGVGGSQQTGGGSGGAQHWAAATLGAALAAIASPSPTSRPFRVVRVILVGPP